MAHTARARQALITRILDGAGQASQAQRRAAFDHAGLAGPLGALVDKVVRQPSRVTDEDVAAARATGLSEDQLFEIVVCGAVGEATRQQDAALAALDAATGRE